MPDSHSALPRFQAVVLADPALQRELRRTPDRASFVALVLERAREHGCAVDAPMIEAALDAGARAWTMHWIEP
jgi:hypothetical protein